MLLINFIERKGREEGRKKKSERWLNKPFPFLIDWVYNMSLTIFIVFQDVKVFIKIKVGRKNGWSLSYYGVFVQRTFIILTLLVQVLRFDFLIKQSLLVWKN